MITRIEWDNLQVGDVLFLKGYISGIARFEVTHVDVYTPLARWTDGVIVSPGNRTVVEVRNEKYESLRFDSYLCKNPLSRIIPVTDDDNNVS